MKSSSSHQTKEALARRINNAPKAPDKVWTDQGKEFKREFKKFCTVMSTEKYHTDSGTTAERAIRSIKALIVRYLEEKWVWRYIDKLPALVATITRRVNRSIGLAPNSVDKSHVLYLISLQENKIEERTPKFNEVDTVRIASKNTAFRKGYRQQFTNETFKVYKTVSMKPPSYLLTDEEGEVLRGKFYEPEMILATNK